MSVKIITEVWEHGTIGGTPLNVLLSLADNADAESREAWPSVAYIARRVHATPRSVQRALRTLERRGDISVASPANARHRATTWAVHPGRGDASVRGVRKSPVTEATGEASPASPEPSVEPPTSEEKDLSPQNGNGTTSSSRAVASRTREAEAEALFAYWQEECGHPRAKLSAARRRKIEQRLRDGRTVEEIITAIQGAAKAAYVGSDGVKYDDIELICRSDEKLDLFIARATAAPALSEPERKLWDGLRRLHEAAEASRAIDGTAEEVTA